MKTKTWLSQNGLKWRLSEFWGEKTLNFAKIKSIRPTLVYQYSNSHPFIFIVWSSRFLLQISLVRNTIPNVLFSNDDTWQDAERRVEFRVAHLVAGKPARRSRRGRYNPRRRYSDTVLLFETSNTCKFSAKYTNHFPYRLKAYKYWKKAPSPLVGG